jgi:hypothetical protein
MQYDCVISPVSFLSPQRLDLIIKHRFFRHLLEGGIGDAEAIYRLHILGRTGGREKKSHKVTLEHYVIGCHELLESFKGRGFDPEYPVLVGSNDVLMDGAHRIACSLTLGVDVRVRRLQTPGRAQEWGCYALKRHGMAVQQIDALLAECARLSCT